MKKTPLFLFILLTYCVFSLHGKRLNYGTFDNITLLPEATFIGFFTQDPTGVMWIGSDQGLYSYDGYTAQAHYKTGTPSNAKLHCGLVLDEQRLFLGTDKGVLIYNYQTDRYETPDIDFPSDVRTMLRYKEQVWIGTLNGLFCYHIPTKKLRQFEQKEYPGLPHSTVYSIIQRSGSLYIGTYNGLCRYDPDSDRFERIPLPREDRKSNLFINSLLEDTANRCIWIGTEGHLFKYDPVSGRAEKIDLFPHNSVKSLVLDSENNLLLGTDNGLYVYHDPTKKVQHYTHDSRNNNSLINHVIWNLFRDKEQNIWLGTDLGISFIHHIKDYTFTPISQLTQIGDGNQFFVLFKDSRDNFWLGGNNGIILSRPGEAETGCIWYQMGDKRHPISHNRIRDIYEDKDKMLWVTTDGSINRYDYERKQFIHYTITDSTSTLNANWAYKVFEDRKGRLWIAAYLGGIFVADKEKLLRSAERPYIADHTFSSRDGLSGNYINQLVPDRQGNVWALSFNSNINKIHTDNNTIEEVPIRRKNGTPEFPSLLLGDREGFIWAALKGELVRISPEDHTTEHLVFDPFNESYVLSMAEEGKHLWISTTNGVWCIDKQGQATQRVYSINRYITSSYYDERSKTMHMGGIDGYISFSPSILSADRPPRNIVLTALSINNRPFGEHEAQTTSIRRLDSLYLKHDENNLIIEFSDLQFAKEEQSRFVYKLQDQDPDWQVLKQGLNKITYTNLKPGEYKLFISKLNVSGQTDERSKSLWIKILPPWYLTAFAKAVYVLLALSLIAWTINFFRVKNRLKIERMEREKVLEVSNMKMNFFTDISHELKTPLSLIVAPVSKLLVESQHSGTRRQLELIQKNALKLEALIHQIINFKRIDDTANTPLILSQVEFVAFARSIFSIFEEGWKSLLFRFEAEPEQMVVALDLLKMESIISNLLSNACKFSPEGGCVSLRIRLENDKKRLAVVVEDNGIGIPQADLPFVFDRFFQSRKTQGDKRGTGIGLYMVKNYVRMHQGDIQIVSQEDAGTRVAFSIPVEPAPLPEAGEGDTAETDTDKALVLIVEDKPEIAGFIASLLHPQYRTRIASNGKIGLEICEKLRPDLIVTDLVMPVMNGLDMCKQIKKQTHLSTIPIVMLTAKEDQTLELESIQLSIDALIYKPFDPAILRSRIEQLLGQNKKIEEKIRIEQLSRPQQAEAQSQDERFLAKITHLIEDKIADPDFNVNALCEMSGISSKQLYRKIKPLTGLSPVEYIKSIRMKKAAMLLEQRKFSVAEVMYMVGFSSHSYFSKCFQAAFGKTPKEFMDD